MLRDPNFIIETVGQTEWGRDVNPGFWTRLVLGIANETHMDVGYVAGGERKRGCALGNPQGFSAIAENAAWRNRYSSLPGLNALAAILLLA
jgi:hypothetical protein